MQDTATHFVVGTYADGTVSSKHVTTSDIEAYKSGLVSGFLPFETVTSTVCEDNWDCTCITDLHASLV